VCLTGGPCAGKTTVLSTIISRFSAQGVRTYAVPEAATLLITGGLSFTDMTPKKAQRYQEALLRTQLDLEERFLHIATAEDGPALIVCDRGAMDGRAYCDAEAWAAILATIGLDNVHLRDHQYDAVYHMVTAAKGAEQFYGAGTNAVRLETPAEARALDDKTLGCYLGHPHLRIFDNSTDFATKIERVLTCIAEQMGVGVPTHGSYRRYLIRSPAPTTLPVPTVQIEVEISILQSSDPDCELRLLTRGQNHRWSYFLQELQTVDAQPLLTERRLTYDEYQDRRKQIDEGTEVIQKSSLSFTYNHQYFEMGTFVHPAQFRGIALLYIEVDGSGAEPDLPPFIAVEREVTEDPAFSSSAIAQVDYGVLETRIPCTPEPLESTPTFDRSVTAPAWSQTPAPLSLRFSMVQGLLNGGLPSPITPKASHPPAAMPATRFSSAALRSQSASPKLLKRLAAADESPRSGTVPKLPL